jgi:transcriptional regulator with XRE-family HTH domain
MSIDARAERLNRGLSQRALATECGVSLTTVQRLEDGRGAHPENAKKVADYFGIKVTDLMPVEQPA